MESLEFTVRLGDLYLTLRGRLSLDSRGYLCRFQAENAEADVCCTVLRDDALQPPVQPPQVRETWKEIRMCDDGLSIAYYSDLRHESCYALLTENAPDRLTLRLNGTMIHDPEKHILSCIAMEHLMLRHKQAIFHAAWIERGGRALLFSGASGAGKSTHTALWQSLCHTPICNGDKALLFRRGDALWVGGLPYAGSSGICTTRRLPVDAIVFLSHGKDNVLTRPQPSEAVKLLVSQMPLQSWNADDVSAALNFALDIAEKVPVYTYSCLPDASAVAYLESRI